MLGSPPRSRRVFASACFGFLILPLTAPAVPTAVDDSYPVAEDTPLVVSNAPLIDSNFDGGGGVGGPVTFDGNWRYLDRIENENGANQGYPIDGSGNVWNSAAFNVASSTIGPWGSAPMPLQAGTINGFPGAPDVLAGIVPGANLVTTYLFRNTFTLTPAQVAIASWTANILVDDGCVIYINGVEVDRINLSAGILTTTTFTSTTGDENNYLERPLSLGGLLVAGTNTIAIEVHQADLGSSDVGINLILSSGSSAADGFVYQDDFFGTGIPARADGSLDPVGGFGASAGLNVEVGRGNFFEGGAKSGAWTRDFELGSAGQVEVSFRYRHLNSDGLDPGDSSEVILAIDGVRYGDGPNSSVSFIDDGGDSGWQLETHTISLGAGAHTLALGIYNNQSRRDDEFASVWFDDVLVEFSGGAAGVLENDSGLEPLTATLVSTTSIGALNFASDGTFSYVPPLNFFGSTTFTYRAIDASGSSNLATVRITVTPVNDAPSAGADSYATAEDVPLVVGALTGVLANDSDVEGQAMTSALAAQPAHGSVSLNANGSFTYTPDANFFGADTFTYTASDGADFSPPALVTITVSAGDDPPVANADSYEADENMPLVISESGSGDVVFSTNFDSGAIPELGGGGARVSVEGYSGLGPFGNQFGGQFWNNGTGVAANGVQTPTVLTLNNLPAHTSLSIEFLLAVIDTWDGAADDFAADIFAIQVDGATVFRHYLHQNPAVQSYVAPPAGLLSSGTNLAQFAGGNDSAYDMSLEAALRDIPHTGPTATITFAAGGGNWDGSAAGESWAMDNLTVSVSDSPREVLLPLGASWSYRDDGSDQGAAWRDPAFDDSGWATGNAKLGYGGDGEVTTVSFGADTNNKYATTYFRRDFNVADPEVFSNLLVTVQHDDGAAVYLNGTEIIRTNLVGSADSGEFTIATMPGELETNFFAHSIDPALLVAGTNVIAVEVHQANGSSSDLGFNLSVAGIRSRSAGGVLANDLELDGQELTASLVTNAANGNVVLAQDGTFTYTPGLNFHGTDSFTYAASDGTSSDEATVTITVIPGPNDIPETAADSYSGTEDQTLVVSAVNGVLKNDVDPDLDPLTAVLHTQAEHGTVTLNSNGSFSYAPDANFAGVDSFLYVADDTIDTSAPTLVTLTIANVADRPIVANDVYVAQPGLALSVPAPGVLGNDTDADSGTVLSTVLVSNTASGALNLASNGGFTYTPAGGFVGSVTFTYRASDGGLQSADIATVTIHVNRRPIAAGNSYSVVEDKVLSTPAPGVLGNDSDPEGSPLSAVLVTPPANGLLSLAPNGSFTYTPDPDYAGADSFVYAASDGLQRSPNAVVAINVSAVNDAPVATEDSYAVLSGSPISIPAGSGVLANDVDVDGPTLSAVLQSTTSNGTLVLSSNGAFTYTPVAAFAGNDAFIYTASDGALSSSPTTVTLSVGLAAEAILISEIMYHPASENNAEEFIELFNTGDAAIDVGGWQFTSGINFTLPAVSIPAGGYLVVAADPAVFTATYGTVPQLVGGWAGGLSNRGERLRLVDSMGNESDDISYSDQGDWAQRRSVTDGGEQGWTWFAAHDGGGSSLELINTGLSNKNGQNWASSNGAPTPGAANSVAAEDVAPLISDVKHRPAVPKSTDPVTITAKLKDVDGSQLGATLFRRISTNSPGAFSNIPMFDDGLHGDGDAGDGEFGIILSPSPNGTISEFYVAATDGVHSRTWPAPTNTGQNANALFQADDEVFNGHYPIYRTIITQVDENRFPFNNRQSNAELNTTFIADNCGDVSVRYLAGMRIRGASSRDDTPPPTRLNLPSDRPWDGEVRLNLNTQYTWLQFIGMKFFQASGLPAPDTKRVSMRRNGVEQNEQGQEGYGSIVHVQPLQEEFLDSHIPSDAGGNLYKKVRPDVDWAYRNGNFNAYPADGWSKPTNSSENDWSDLDEWLRVMNQAPGAPNYIAQVEAVANLDQWMQWFAVMTILNNGETNASNGADDDYSVYSGVLDPRFILIPHDLDTILGQGDGSTITDPQSTIFDMIERGDSLAPLVPLFQNPAILTRYYTALREQLQTTFSPEQFNALLDNHLTGWVPAGTIANMKTYMDARRAYITGLVDAQLGPPPAATLATTNGTLVSAHGSLFINEVAAAYSDGVTPDAIELRNTGASAVSLAGMSLSDDPDLPQRYVFPAGTSIAANGYLVINANTLGFALDADGDSISLYNSGGVLLDSVVFGLQIADSSISRTGAGANTWALTVPTIGSVNAAARALGSPDTLRINEWLVRPQVTFDKDFVELYNPAALPVALGGLVITDEPVAYPQRHSLPPLSFVAANGFALLYPVGSGGASAENASELPFKLSADYGWLSISGTNGIEIDEVHYICQRNDIAFGRETDGAASIVDFDLPTPGFSNGTDLTRESGLLQSLRITEIMYHPTGDGLLEYLRLKNIGSASINLGGIRMSNGINIDLPAVDLAPGGEAVIVRDQAAYEAAYGPGGILGQYTGALSNGGERLRLEIISLGYGILDFEFKDGWYPLTDGLGASLGIIDANAERETWGDKESWMALGGDLFSYDGWVATNFNSNDPDVIGKGADPDGDGIDNGGEYAQGTDPNSGDRSGLSGVTIEGDFLTLTYQRSKTASAQWLPQAAGDVENWQLGPSQVMLSDDGSTEIWKATDTVPITAGRPRFMRVRIIVP